MHTINTELEAGLSAPAIQIEPPRPRWRLSTRVAFRFCAIYFPLYILLTQMWSSMVRLPVGRMPSPADSSYFQAAVTWIAAELLGFSTPLVRMSGSGDKPYDWSLAFGLLCFSAIVTLVWSVLDRRRPSYAGLHKWFRLYLRFGLAGTMITYGMIKAIPSQMPFPNLTRLLEPYGHFSLMGVLWSQVGASPAYQSFTGIVELAAAVMLIVPGLTLPGALLALMSSSMIFTLNMTYDVPVKLFAFHLILMSLVLLAPDMRRLVNLFVLNRPVPPSSEVPLVRNLIVRRVLVGAQLVVGGWLLWSSYSSVAQSYAVRGPNAPKPPLYGIWTIETMTIDDQLRSPLVTDYDRWRRVVVQGPSAIYFQRMDDTLVSYGARVDLSGKTMTLTRAAMPAAQAPPATVGRLTFEQPSPDRLVLEGEIDGRKIRMEATHYDRSNFRLVQGGFHWVQDYPVNR